MPSICNSILVRIRNEDHSLQRVRGGRIDLLRLFTLGWLGDRPAPAIFVFFGVLNVFLAFGGLGVCSGFSTGFSISFFYRLKYSYSCRLAASAISLIVCTSFGLFYLVSCFGLVTIGLRWVRCLRMKPGCLKPSTSVACLCSFTFTSDCYGALGYSTVYVLYFSVYIISSDC